MKRLWVISDLSQCRDCRLEKPVSDFVKNSRLPSGRTKQCKQCHNEYLRRRREDPTVMQRHKESSAKWRERNPGADRDKHLRRKFGITAERYDEILLSQNGVCAICNRDEPVVRRALSGKEKLSVDHCHITGRVRGLLCFRCNTALGAFGDDPAMLMKAAAYLEGESS